MPISPRPTVLPGRRSFVMGREIVEQLDVCGESRSGKDSLEEIVAKQSIFLYFALESRFECVQVVNSLAGVGTFPEEVLIDV